MAKRVKPKDTCLAGEPLTPGWFAINNSIEPITRLRRYTTGKWWKISNQHGDAIYRTIRFTASLKPSENGDVKSWPLSLDYDGWVLLSGEAEDLDGELNLTLQPAIWPWEIIWTTRSHPDPAIRVATWLAYISVALGLLGAVLGVIGVLLAVWSMCKC